MFFNYLKGARVIKKSPMNNIKYLKNERKPLGFITDDEFIKLLLLMDKSKYHEYRDSVLIQLLFDTGMRIGECLLINVVDVDIQKRAILLQAENTKGESQVKFLKGQRNRKYHRMRHKAILPMNIKIRFDL